MPKQARTWIATALLAFFAFSANANDITVINGNIDKVIDGDTLAVNKTTIRLFGIDAPEIDTPRGPDSAAALRRIIAGREVSCVRIHTDKYRRTVAICRTGQHDIGARMIELGHAEPYPFFSQGFYRAKPR